MNSVSSPKNGRALWNRVEAFASRSDKWTFFMRRCGGLPPRTADDLADDLLLTASGLDDRKSRSIATETSQNGGPD
jgi:hypothetical protein